MAYLVISTCVPESTRTLSRLKSGMWSRSRGDKDSFQRQSNNEETEMRSKCAQRLVQPALFCSYRGAFIENSKNANNVHIGPRVLHLGGEELYIDNKDVSAA